MPTLYTALRARNRHPIVPPNRHPLPNEQVFAASPDMHPLEAAVQLSARQKVPGRLEAGAATPHRKVVVIGAGLAGLCAAYELAGMKYDVEVFEARNRCGGRVHSLDTFVAGKVAEGGGS